MLSKEETERQISDWQSKQMQQTQVRQAPAKS